MGIAKNSKQQQIHHVASICVRPQINVQLHTSGKGWNLADEPSSVVVWGLGTRLKLTHALGTLPQAGFVNSAMLTQQVASDLQRWS